MTFKNKEEKYLHQFNELVAKHSWELPENTLPPIFIVGAPRSGTTLLTQVLISSFELGYIDNISSKFWTNPLMGVIISNAIEPSGLLMTKSEVVHSNWSNGSFPTWVNRLSMTIPCSPSPATVSCLILDCVINHHLYSGV